MMADDPKSDNLKPEPEQCANYDELLKWAEGLLRQEEERHEQLLQELGDMLGKMLDSTSDSTVPSAEDNK